MVALRLVVLVALLPLGAGCLKDNVPTAPDEDDLAFRLEPVASGFNHPVYVTQPVADGPLYVLEQGGIVKTLEGSEQAMYLDISERVQSGGERGLLGLAFHPDFATNGLLYAHYSALDDDSTLSRFTRDRNDPDSADPSSETVLLAVADPYPNHNGGSILFGSDGYLYVALGDGGSAGDPEGNGQDKDALLGKILRLDVDRPATSGDEPMGYSAPADNPFVGADGRDEVLHYGLRNPWRMSFDRATGDLWVGDVGQGNYEEVNRIPAGAKGLNLGWNAFEGTHRYRSGDIGEHLRPVAEYDHDDGCSVTGGYVYRGTAIPNLVGTYLFGDFCSGNLWTLRPDGDDWDLRLALKTGLTISSFGEDVAGELYVVHHGVGDTGGSIHKLVPAV